MSKLVNEASIPALLEEMSVKEKVDLLVGKTVFSSQEFPQYGIPSIRYLDGATGVNLMQYMGELVGLKMAVESEGDARKKRLRRRNSRPGRRRRMTPPTTRAEPPLWDWWDMPPITNRCGGYDSGAERDDRGPARPGRQCPP